MSNVLLAEDDVTMVKLLETLLKMEGYQVSALDADASVAEAVLADPPDILLMDVHLSNNNGIEEMKKLRAAPGGGDVRVLMVSGLDFKAECLANGADGFLQKPFMPDDLLSALQSMS